MPISGPLTGAPLSFPQGTTTPFDYVVGPPGSPARFRSVQAAIDAAVADGGSAANPKQVLVLPGEYLEDVAMAAGVLVKGFSTSGIRIRGTVTFDLVDQGGIDATYSSLASISVEPPAGQPAVRSTGTTAQFVFLIECQFFVLDQPAIVADNTGIDGGDTSFTATSQIRMEFVPGGGGVPLVDVQAGSVALTLTQVSGDSTGDDAVVVDNGSFLVAFDVRFGGRINVIDGFVFALRPQVEVFGQAAVTLGAAGFCVANFPILGTDTSPAVDGTGVFGYDVISYANGGSGIAPGVIIAGPIPVQAVENTLYAADPAEWVGPPPLFVGDALNRMADLLVALNAGPIP
jgi:hypothetical protein